MELRLICRRAFAEWCERVEATAERIPGGDDAAAHPGRDRGRAHAPLPHDPDDQRHEPE